MNDIALHEAKNRLSELIHRVEAGEKILITRRGKVLARLVPPVDEAAGQCARDSIDALRVSRKDVSLGRLGSADLIRDGRRWS